MVKAIEVDRITKYFGRRLVLNNVSFSVDQGDIFGYLGPNGSGKTTTIRILLSLLKPNQGNVSVLGHDTLRNLMDAKSKVTESGCSGGSSCAGCPNRGSCASSNKSE